MQVAEMIQPLIVSWKLNNISRFDLLKAKTPEYRSLR